MTQTVAPQDEQQAETPLPENMPGDVLKKGRERRQLSTQEVSEQLNLKHSFVCMIEEDDYGSLPGATFIRGYLRAYAKLVDVDGEALVETYNASFNEEPKPEERYKPVDTIKPQRNFSDPLIKYTTLAVIAALIALSIVWWQSRNGAEPLSLIQSDTVTLETSEGEVIIAQMDLSGAEETTLTEEILTDDNTTEGTAEELVSADEATVAEGSEETATAGAASEVTGDAAVEENVETVTESGETAAPVEDTMTPEQIGESVTAQERFIITYTEECWVEVTDGRGIKVVSNLKQPGEESLVEGVAPFKLMIGNAGGAQVVYEGDVVNLEPYTNRNNIARFTLGE